MAEQIENKSDKINKEKTRDPINAHNLIEFLEYEEALTKDKSTASRIRTLLKLLGIWS